MTGREVEALRTRAGLSVKAFADLIGASTPTVYRWEAAENQGLAISPFQAKVIEALTQVLERKQGNARTRFLYELRSTLTTDGGLRGLYVLLVHFFGSRR